MKLTIDVTGTNIDMEQEGPLRESSLQWLEHLRSGRDYYTGWVNLPLDFDPALLERIQTTAEEIRQKCDLLVVVGVGGSYLGAKAVIDALNGSREDYPDILFAGYT